MAKKILVATVGGSHEPILKSVAQLKPNFVHFICSDDAPRGKGSYHTVIGEGKVCADAQRNLTLPNIPTQAGLETGSFAYSKIKDFDDFNCTYEHCKEVLRELYEHHPEAKLTIDYTGGTKSMTAGLLMAGVEFPEATIALVTGSREDLVKVAQGTERVRLFSFKLPFVEAELQKAMLLIKQYDYAAAEAIIQTLLLIPDLPRNLEPRLESYASQLSGLNAWDVFHHDEAAIKLSDILGKQSELISQLNNIRLARKIIQDYTSPPKKPGLHGYEPVIDLLFNANRKSVQHRFDDAVARLYRAMELAAQIRLWLKYQIKTGDVDRSKLPEDVRQKIEATPSSAPLQLGLIASYELLDLLGDSEIGELYLSEKGHILKAIKHRNYSILAHGFTPILEQQYQEVEKLLCRDFLWPLLEKITGSSKADYRQLPQQLIQR